MTTEKDSVSFLVSPGPRPQRKAPKVSLDALQMWAKHVDSQRKKEAHARYSDGKGNTWNGIGETPRWLKDALIASGGKLTRRDFETKGAELSAAREASDDERICRNDELIELSKQIAKLQKQRDALDEKIQGLQDGDRKAALAQMQEMIKTFGFSPAEVFEHLQDVVLPKSAIRDIAKYPGLAHLRDLQQVLQFGGAGKPSEKTGQVLGSEEHSAADARPMRLVIDKDGQPTKVPAQFTDGRGHFWNGRGIMPKWAVEQIHANPGTNWRDYEATNPLPLWMARKFGIDPDEPAKGFSVHVYRKP